MDRNARRFNLISWVITLLLAAGLIGGALWWRSRGTATPVPAETPGAVTASPSEYTGPALPPGGITSLQAIGRRLVLKTTVPEDRPRYTILTHVTERGDSVFGIASQYGLKAESVFWANYDILQEAPDNLKIGVELLIPPIDGVLYRWQDGDTLQAVADYFDADPAEIIAWAGNDIDLSDPDGSLQPDMMVMIPGGKRQFEWVIPTSYAVSNSGTANVGGVSCGDNFVGGTAFLWPADARSISGNDYGPEHLAIDIAAGTGAPVYAAENGIVTMAQGGWNYGYGNVIQIYHGDGWVTLYAHLSAIFVTPCQQVYSGQQIATAGNTGNSFGAHLHFEVRHNGGRVNPWYVIVR